MKPQLPCRRVVPAAAALLMLVASARGHEVRMDRAEIRVLPTAKTVEVQYLAEVGTEFLALMGVATAPSAALTDSQRDRVAERIDAMLHEHLTLTLDNAVTVLASKRRKCRTVSGGVGVSILYSANLPDPPRGPVTVFLVDNNPHVKKGRAPTIVVLDQDGVSDVRREKNGRAVKFRFDPPAASGGETTFSPVKADRPAEDTKAAPAASGLSAFLEAGEPATGTILLALCVAFGLGMVHALGPGHGKAMVAAYLIGSRGRVRDAIFLGGIVTFTHVISVVLIGVIALVLSRFIVPRQLMVWISAASGLLIVVVGFWLMVRLVRGRAARSRAAAHAAHGHAHSHDGHAHPRAAGGRVTLGGIVSLGVAGGMVPCPTALVVLLAAVALHRVLLGLAMILAFSVGLACVLILIGVLTVTASGLIRRFSQDRGWIRALPIVSSAVIILVGLAIVFRALAGGGIISVGI